MNLDDIGQQGKMILNGIRWTQEVDECIGSEMTGYVMLQRPIC